MLQVALHLVVQQQHTTRYECSKMFALRVWFSQDIPKFEYEKLLLYSELGGNFLGMLDITSVEKDATKLDKNATKLDKNATKLAISLQRQAYKLMKHEWRPPSEVVLKVDKDLLLPFSFGYTQDFEQYEEHEGCNFIERLQDALKHKKRIFMTYDDTDEYVNTIFEVTTFKVVRKQLPDKRMTVDIDVTSNFALLPLNLTRFCNNCGCDTVTIRNYYDVITKDMTFLEGTCVQNLQVCGVVPLDWEPLRNLVTLHMRNLDTLHMDVKVVLSGISKLVALKHLTLDLVNELPDDLAFLDLHEVHLTFSPCVVKRLLSLLVMPNLSTLSITGSRDITTRGIPLALGKLTSLKRLSLVDNAFTGSIPSELGRLTNLTELFIRDYEGLDISLPKEVSDLHHLTKIDVAYMQRF